MYLEKKNKFRRKVGVIIRNERTMCDSTESQSYFPRLLTDNEPINFHNKMNHHQALMSDGVQTVYLETPSPVISSGKTQTVFKNNLARLCLTMIVITLHLTTKYF
uniref:Uncharacterized protein n=1 Tax=Cacopsylla melanoneura TaxID=428564 RepID=A0A8D8XC27_9HEMI